MKKRVNFIISGCEGSHGTCDYSPIDENDNEEAIEGVRELMRDLVDFIKKNPDRDIFIECNYYSKEPVE